MTKALKQHKAFLFSVLLHVIVLIILVCSFEFSSPMFVVSNNDTKVIEAIALQDSPIIAPPPKTIVEPTPVPTPEPAPKPEVQPPPPKPEVAAKPEPAHDATPEKKLAIDDKKQKPLVKKDITKDLLADLEDEIAKQTKAKQKNLKNKFKSELRAQSEKALEQLMKEQKRASAAGPRSQHTQGIIDKYRALILQAIAQQWVIPSHVNKRLTCELLIKLAPSGTVLEVAIIKSSGDILLDRSARAAVFKASPLPVPTDTHSFEPFREFVLKVKPENVLENIGNQGSVIG
ncbi:MAG TPA: cell envelope integrity protein TolA [Gammaproteobacteria bacterium]|nr:cell envelope integrity protein TolA [Gammaproteobacteria bacterium]